MNCGIGYRQGLDPKLLWLWCRLAAAALIQPLAWEPPYAAGVALKKAKRQKKKKKRMPGDRNQKGTAKKRERGRKGSKQK